MRSLTRPPRECLRCLAAVVVAAAACVTTPAAAQTDARTLQADGITPHIDAVLYHPDVVRHIQAWGLTMADVQHDVDAMPPPQRAELAFILNRRWSGTDTQTPAALQAQFLVMMSLMRESTLFANVVSTGPVRLLR